MTDKTDVVIYIDRASVEHNALVVGVNNLNPDVLDVTYFDMKSDALKTEFGVPHMSDESKKETNPTLPQYSLNCWKKDGEEHLALPVDHPANDHPFELKKQDDSGRIVAKARPEFEKHLAEVAAASTTEATEELPQLVEQKPEDPNIFTLAPLGLPPLPKVLTDAAEASIAAEQRDPSLPMGTGPSAPQTYPANCKHPQRVYVAGNTYCEDCKAWLYAGSEPAAPAEPDVIAQLDAAGPAPVVEEKKPDDAA